MDSMTEEEHNIKRAKNTDRQAVLCELKKMKKNSKYLAASLLKKNKIKDQMKADILRKR